VAFVELVPLQVAGPTDTTTTLPTPVTQVVPGDSFALEVWARTDDAQGLSSVSMNIQFSPAVAVVNTVTHSTIFSELQGGTVDNVAGTVAGLTGSHLSSCADQVGVAPTWARVAVLDMQAVGAGSLVVTSGDTGVLALGTAVCGFGDLLPAQVSYGVATLPVSTTPIPTVSTWGLVVLSLLLLAAGTVVALPRVLRE